MSDRPDNPYSPPAGAGGTGPSHADYVPSVFGLHGRIGRARYLMYSVYPTCAALVLLAPMFMLPNIFLKFAVIGFGLLSLLSHLLIVAARRLDDMDQPRWLIVLLGVPLVNGLFVLYLLSFPGNPQANRHGAAPTSSLSALTKGLWVSCALPPLILLALYLLATFKLPV
ncbi:DUF805 domain-containing protein [Massilia violaceinigra]|uniref:DUF805 domain-containing protein n=1 Tax=Massilia violaceinigra TaxID=2045208 RepID=A0ABY4A2Q0_9BURK|nr:DUF805 domain-containing protein [Massilia violaceinigra]UOD27959.1 DUF805 domain-containing protein [Massilia violaceinigra]